MKKITLIFVLLFSISISNAQDLYVKTYGKADATPVLFLHGGPGYNSVAFEISTAQNLALSGFFVIIYDRRGEGRSLQKDATYTFNEAFSDIDQILEKYKIKKVSLIGHSFGGILGTIYASKNTEKVSNLILVGAPVSIQETFKTIIASSKKIYEEKDDKTNLNYISMLENMDNKSFQYASYSFMHAMQNGFYSPKILSNEAKNIYNELSKSQNVKLASQMTYPAAIGFFKNEKYTSIDLTENLSTLNKQLPIYGFYGKDDGLYSEKQVDDLRKIIGDENLKYLENCSHNVFIDQQKDFIDQVVLWNK